MGQRMTALRAWWAIRPWRRRTPQGITAPMPEAALAAERYSLPPLTPEPVGPPPTIAGVPLREVVEIGKLADGTPLLFRRPEPTEWERRIQEKAYADAAEAIENARKHLAVRLETLRPAMVTEIQRALQPYFAECQRHERRPLTWDTASIGADGAITAMLMEMI